MVLRCEIEVGFAFALNVCILCTCMHACIHGWRFLVLVWVWWSRVGRVG